MGVCYVYYTEGVKLGSDTSTLRPNIGRMKNKYCDLK